VNGFEVALRLRAHDRCATVPIIMLTARGFAADVLRGREVGADGYVTKPFSVDEVLQKIRVLVPDAPG
jgi:DNA-binding response OmpR family regulator